MHRREYRREHRRAGRGEEGAQEGVQEGVQGGVQEGRAQGADNGFAYRHRACGQVIKNTPRKEAFDAARSGWIENRVRELLEEEEEEAVPLEVEEVSSERAKL